MRHLLERRWGASAEQALLVAHLSRGCLGWAVAALRDTAVLEGRKADLDALAGLLYASYDDRFSMVAEWLRKLGRTRDGLDNVLQLWLGWWRDVLLVRTGCVDSITNVDRRTELDACASSLDNNGVLKGVKAIRLAMERLSANANLRLCLETLMLEVPQLGGSPVRAASGSVRR